VRRQNRTRETDPEGVIEFFHASAVRKLQAIDEGPFSLRDENVICAQLDKK
jgi:hypothetical protein